MFIQFKNTKVEVSVGETFSGTDQYQFGNLFWRHSYHVKEVEQSSRFGYPTALLTVDIDAVDTDGGIRRVETNTKRWLEQCF